MKKVYVLLTGMLTMVVWADISISPTSIDYAVAGGGAAITTSGSGSWSAVCDVGWITIVRANGSAGVSCTYVVSKNNSADSRIGHITINGNIYTVTQKGCPVTLTPTSASLDKFGGSGVVTANMDAGVTWTALPSDSWITIEPTSGAGATEIHYTVSAYNEIGSRAGTIRIGSEKFSVTQAGIDVTLSPGSTNITKNVCIIPLQVMALSETKWAVTPNVTWISVLDGGNGFGGSQVNLAIAENPSFEKRTGTVSIGSAIFTVVQAGTDDVNFKILPEIATASPKGAFANVAVYATPDATWSAESMDSWIKITEGECGKGNGNVKYVTMSNPELEQRTGKIKFTPPVYTPDLDLYAGLTLWIKDRTNLEGNETRQMTHSLTREFDGSFSNPLTGTAFPARNTRAYTLAFSFSVKEMNCINRLLKVKNTSLYLNAQNELCIQDKKTSFSVANANTYYTLVLRLNESLNLNVYAGATSTELIKVGETILDDSLDFTTGCPVNLIEFGYCDYPSAGYWQGGIISNVRFWGRALNDYECINADIKLGMVAENEIPLGAPNGVYWTYYMLNGNAYSITNNDYLARRNLGTLTGFCDAQDRKNIDCHSVDSNDGTAALTIPSFETMFEGTCVLNGGQEWTGDWLGQYTRRNDTWIPFAASAMYGSHCDATYALWIKVDKYPTSGTHVILRRTVSVYTDAFGSNVSPQYPNRDFSILLGASGEIVVQGSSLDELTINNAISLSEWHLITIVGKSSKNITVYVDGKECGNGTSGMTLGYLPPVDQRSVTYWIDDSWGPRYSGSGSVVACGATMKIGGWQGSMDAVQIYQGALSSSDVQNLYEQQRFKYVYHTVEQGIQEPSITPEVVHMTKFGGTTNVSLSVVRTIKWTACANDDWLSIVGETNGTGAATITLRVDSNPFCVPRIGTVTVGTKILTINQEELNCEIEADQTVFPTEAGDTGGMGIISVSPEGNGSWTAESDVSWIYCYPDSGTGSYDVYFFVEDMGSTAASRSGKITIGGKTIEITQRGYDLSIDPQVCEVGGNAGAGVIGVAADEDAVWTAIADVPWISIIKTAKGYVHYTFTDNTTGQTRIGHINISGEEYTLTQTCKLDLNTTVVGQGTIMGGGKYAQGVSVDLKAIPADGYEFSHWSGDVVGVTTNTSVIMDTVKNVTATFIPESAAQVLAEKKAAQGGFYTRDQIHNLEVGNLILDVDTTTGKVRVGVQLQETSNLSNPNWQPVEVSASDVDLGSDGTVGIKASATGNAKFFRVVAPNK